MHGQSGAARLTRSSLTTCHPTASFPAQRGISPALKLAHPALAMNDLPPFLQMFVRLFAALALGVWLQLMAVNQADKKAEKERERTEQRAQAQAEHKADEVTKPACPADAPKTQQ